LEVNHKQSIFAVKILKFVVMDYLFMIGLFFVIACCFTVVMDCKKKKKRRKS